MLMERKPRRKKEYLSLLRPLSPPRLVGGNVVVEVDDEQYQKWVEDLKFSVVGKLMLRKGDPNPITKKVVRGLEDFILKILPSR